ncbi:hypothetical protein BCR36DRAFT_373172 [Piromyces finnis]|uniref:Uncharacterized protein n=1 Tax=Piromyces finnis TaxID=1754191 RepID=A0A1Y1V0R1_9FUNG|nr:hypothetical protein BCR36DRAFT_373172 [Piromyces finnis]|eukprot:ORX44697.1 hypothetical protein BCR36DRAFT_373172 [Piromyces finnis]
MAMFKSQCLKIFKNELYYYCNPRTVTLYLKECEDNKNNSDNPEILNLDNENLEEILMANRYVKPGVFDSILPTKNENLNSSSIKNNDNNNLSRKSLQSKASNYSASLQNNNDNNSNIINSKCSIKLSKNTTISDSFEDELCSNDNSYNSDEYDDEVDNINKDFYIFEYNIPRTFNELQIECLIRFFLKTYIQHINIIAYVFSHPQENIFVDYNKTVVPPVVFEELEHGIIAEEWPNWVQEQENKLIKKKKEEEEVSNKLERKKKEEEILKEKERIEEELAKQKLKEAQDNIINSLLSLLYKPSDKKISELPVIPYIKSDEENNESKMEQENIVDTDKDEKEKEDNDKENYTEDNIKSKKFNISNPKFRNSFLNLWKKQVIEREQKQKELLDNLNLELQQKNEKLELAISEQSLIKLENSRQELIKKIKEITKERDDNDDKNIRIVYNPEQVETIIQNSEILKDQYFTQLQKHIEEVITKNTQYVTERIDNINIELENMRCVKDDKNSQSNKKGSNKKDTKKTTTPPKKETTKKVKSKNK